MKILGVIPARGGSKGIPRKNLRMLGGKPLVQYAMESLLNTPGVTHVVVTSDDLEIQLISEKVGAHFVHRTPDLCADDVPLDPVVYDAYTRMEKTTGETYDAVLTVQPTSPFISPSTISRAIEKLAASGADTLFSVIDDTHLCWQEDRETGEVRPAYEKRLNRQWLPKTLKETGSIQFCLRSVISRDTRIGKNVALLELDEKEGMDIDTPLNWLFCESMVQRRRYVFVIVGDEETGTGHAYRAKTLAEYLAGQETVFLCMPGSDIAFSILEQSNYRPIMLKAGDIAGQVLAHSPDIVVNDILDTDAGFITTLQSKGCFVVNIEDLGDGSAMANLVFNALYQPNQESPSHMHFGEEYFCMRGEFRHCPPYLVNEDVKNVLLTFGGTDPCNLTGKTLQAIDAWCAERGVEIEVITGPGFLHWEELNSMAQALKSAVRISNKVQVMAFPMRQADVCFTSCGRTIYELASLGVPTICMAQNEREETHTFARLENGVHYLGRGEAVGAEDILEALKAVAGSHTTRKMMHEVAKAHDLLKGTERILERISNKYKQWKQG